MNVTGSCAKLYTEEFCQGYSIEVLKTDPYQGNLAKWRFANLTVSVGPCIDQCDELVIGPSLVFNQTVNIQIFDGEDCTGFGESLQVTGCTSIPKQISQSGIFIMNNNNCIDLFTGPNCSGTKGKTVEVRRETPFTCRFLKGWKHFKYISPCSYKCLPTDTIDVEHFNDTMTEAEEEKSTITSRIFSSTAEPERKTLNLGITASTQFPRIEDLEVQRDRNEGTYGTSVIKTEKGVEMGHRKPEKKISDLGSFTVILVYIVVFGIISIFLALYVKLQNIMEPITHIP